MPDDAWRPKPSRSFASQDRSRLDTTLLPGCRVTHTVETDDATVDISLSGCGKL